MALIVALDVGFPLIFWQQRPGLYGRPFKLYKFRTMRAAHDKRLGRIPDDQRSSAVGQMLRRTRLDELPQFYNVLIGDASLASVRSVPRVCCSLVDATRHYRSGTEGERIISTFDKLVLDIWYVQNASFVLDLAIVVRTMKMILFGDRINTDAINQARNQLGSKTAFRTTMVPAE